MGYRKENKSTFEWRAGDTLGPLYWVKRKKRARERMTIADVLSRREKLVPEFAVSLHLLQYDRIYYSGVGVLRVLNCPS